MDCQNFPAKAQLIWSFCVFAGVFERGHGVREKTGEGKGEIMILLPYNGCMINRPATDRPKDFLIQQRIVLSKLVDNPRGSGKTTEAELSKLRCVFRVVRPDEKTR
jgi:hypothetical protein